MENLFARSAYQIFLYILLFVGTAALGGFVGYIVSFLYHEQRKDSAPSHADDAEKNTAEEQIY